MRLEHNFLLQLFNYVLIVARAMERLMDQSNIFVIEIKNTFSGLIARSEPACLVCELPEIIVDSFRACLPKGGLLTAKEVMAALIQHEHDYGIADTTHRFLIGSKENAQHTQEIGFAWGVKNLEMMQIDPAGERLADSSSAQQRPLKTIREIYAACIANSPTKLAGCTQ